MNNENLRIEIVNHVKEFAAANEGKPPSREVFTFKFGIKSAAWRGVYWAKWADVLVEAGLKPNHVRLSNPELLDTYAEYALELGRLPTAPDLRLRSKQGRPTAKWLTYRTRFGSRAGVNASLLQHVVGQPHEQQIIAICREGVSRGRYRRPNAILPGFVYMMKSGPLYKIGKALSVEARHKKLSTLMPEDLVILHRIQTDDSYGVEYYWHKRFATKWVKGEWFNLNDDDVKVFRERTVM
ncbi:MAG: GIY-YIG nuclease family protein [Phycisphaeraceae bacterium]|nr:GIY-YIG nuclease family protein [Phycisphaeraceae bacterium]